MNKDLKMPAAEIKAFSGRQIGPCAKLYAEVFGSPPWNENWSVEAAAALINKIINKKHFIGFMAEYNGEATGYLLGYLLGTVFPLNRIYYINELFVETKHQGLSIGKALVDRLMKDLRRKQVPGVVLLTKKDTKAEKFYKRMGFKRVIPGISLNKRIIMFYRLMRRGMGDDNE